MPSPRGEGQGWEISSQKARARGPATALLTWPRHGRLFLPVSWLRRELPVPPHPVQTGAPKGAVGRLPHPASLPITTPCFCLPSWGVKQLAGPPEGRGLGPSSPHPWTPLLGGGHPSRNPKQALQCTVLRAPGLTPFTPVPPGTRHPSAPGSFEQEINPSE